MKRNADTPPLELEVKFGLPGDAEARLAAHPALQDAVEHRTRHDITTYFDTPDRTLARDGASLRVRRRAGRYIQTVKLPVAAQRGGFARQEWEWPVPSGHPELDRLKQTPLAGRLDELRALRPVFVTDVRRRVQTLQREGATIELSLDRGSVRAGKAAEPLHEAELELKDGDPEPLYRLAASLHADLPLVLGTESKADRGWRLCTGQPRAAVKQGKLVLPDEAAAAEAFRRIVGVVLAHLLANVPAAAGGDMEGVHQMRVAVRRLRSVLVLFRPLLEPHAEARFTQELRRIGHVFGAARDWDVFCTETLPEAGRAGVAPSWLALLRGPAERERTAAHAGVTAELQGSALTALVLGLAEWAGEPALLGGHPAGQAMAHPLAEVAADLAGRLEAKAHRRGRHIRRRPDDELHALRKSLKKLRYSVAFLQPLARQRQVKAWMRRCKALQQSLGELNDAVVAVALAEQLGGEGAAELAPAMAALAGWAMQRQHHARREIRKQWHDFRDVPLPIA